MAPDSEQYFEIVLPRLATEGKGALKAVKKWPRVRPHWKRIRRRVCEMCQTSRPSEPRYTRYMVPVR